MVVLRLMRRLRRSRYEVVGTYEVEIQDLVIPSTRYPNYFPFLPISPGSYVLRLNSVSRIISEESGREEGRGPEEKNEDIPPERP
jgi:hypothetical protein